MKVRIKLHDKSIKTTVPRYAKPGDAGLDLVATSKTEDEKGNIVYGTNLCFEIPDGYVGLIFPRSSNANKQLALSNSVAVIDSGYRGEVIMKFKPYGMSLAFLATTKELHKHRINILYNSEIKDVNDFINSSTYEIGDRICQIIIVPYPKIEFDLVEELSDTERDSTGYGSSGK